MVNPHLYSFHQNLSFYHYYCDLSHIKFKEKAIQLIIANFNTLKERHVTNSALYINRILIICLSIFVIKKYGW